MKAVVCILLSSLLVAPSFSVVVEQVFITTTGLVGEMAVSWVTQTGAAASEEVFYGLSPSALTASATGASSVLSVEMAVPIRVHIAVMTDLAPNTKYFYQVGGNVTTFSFINEPSRLGGKTYAVYADLGLASDYALTSLLADAANGAFDAVAHAGDFCYNLEDSGGAAGNAFMNGISPIISTVPFYVVAGNHETMSDNSFAHYLARFAAAGKLGENSGNPGADAARWNSFDDGLVHWVQIDTEIYSYGTDAQIAAQKAWLAADLAAVNRTKTPWVLSQGHKGYYESPKTDWGVLGISEPFADANVDIYFTGHTHNYQRSAAFANEAASDVECLTGNVYTNCKGTIAILAGSPGMDQGMGTRLMPKDILEKVIYAWGYGKLTVCNATHLHWQWFEVAAARSNISFAIPWGQSDVSDEAWVVRTA